jgi:hypothetical protein
MTPLKSPSSFLYHEQTGFKERAGYARRTQQLAPVGATAPPTLPLRAGRNLGTETDGNMGPLTGLMSFDAVTSNFKLRKTYRARSSKVYAKYMRPRIHSSPPIMHFCLSSNVDWVRRVDVNSETLALNSLGTSLPKVPAQLRSISFNLLHRLIIDISNLLDLLRF